MLDHKDYEQTRQLAVKLINALEELKDDIGLTILAEHLCAASEDILARKNKELEVRKN